MAQCACGNGNCGVAIGCCSEPHSECLNCDGSPKKPRQTASAARPAANTDCLACKHPMKMHGRDGPCWVCADEKNVAKLVAPWIKLPRGWKRCSCQSYRSSDPPKPPTPARQHGPEDVQVIDAAAYDESGDQGLIDEEEVEVS